MIIKESELTHFGGLVKVLTRPVTGIGALTTSGIRSALTMQHLTAELKICSRVERRDIETREKYCEVVENNLIDFSFDDPFGNPDKYLAWRTSVWEWAVYRSLQIWKSLSIDQIDRSIGNLSYYARKSLKGKLGANNKVYFEKDNAANWKFIKVKTNRHTPIFRPLSEEAINCCKKRARGA